jgi:hypothetical protein
LRFLRGAVSGHSGSSAQARCLGVAAGLGLG